LPSWICNDERPLQLRSLPEILSNSAAIVNAEICAIPRNACKPLSTSCIWGGQLDRLHDGPLQSCYALPPYARLHADDPASSPPAPFAQRNLPHPYHVGLCPCLHSVYWALACAQQKLAQMMPRTQLILLGCLACPVFMPLSDLRIKASRRFFLTRSPALTGTTVSAVTSTIHVGCSEDKDQPDNWHLSGDT
jgi:hypothetical protein